MRAKPTVNGAIAGMFKDFLQSENLDIPACATYIEHWKVEGRVSIVELGFCLLFIHEKTQKPMLGLEIANYFQPTYVGLLGYLMLPCRTLRDALAQFNQYYALMWDGFVIDIEEKEGYLIVSWDVPALTLYKNHENFSDIIRIGYELGISCFIKTVQQLTKNTAAFQPTKIVLPGTKPASVEHYEQFFDCKFEFCNERASVQFDGKILDEPIDLSNDFFKELLFKRAEAQLKSMSESSNTEQNAFLLKVKGILGQGLNEGSPTLDYVAENMSISKSTLKKRLNTNGINFQDILDKLRLELAKMYMKDVNLSLAEIAGLLAFSEQSSFNRYFKKISGFSPYQYRKLFLDELQLDSVGFSTI